MSCETTKPALALEWAWTSPSHLRVERVQSSQTQWAVGTDTEKSRLRGIHSELIQEGRPNAWSVEEEGPHPTSHCVT